MKWVCTSIRLARPTRSRNAAARSASPWPAPLPRSGARRPPAVPSGPRSRGVSSGSRFLLLSVEEDLGAQGAARRRLRQGSRVGGVPALGVLGHRVVRLRDGGDAGEDRGLVVGQAQQVAAAVGRLLADPRAGRELDAELDPPGPGDRGPLVLAVEQGDRRQPPRAGQRVIGVIRPADDQELPARRGPPRPARRRPPPSASPVSSLPSSHRPRPSGRHWRRFLLLSECDGGRTALRGPVRSAAALPPGRPAQRRALAGVPLARRPVRIDSALGGCRRVRGKG